MRLIFWSNQPSRTNYSINFCVGCIFTHRGSRTTGISFNPDFPKNAKLYKRNYEGEEEQFKDKKIKEEFYCSDRGREQLLLVGKVF